ncbi:hypothetical protein [Catenulispora pinisilvae]|uniref:hypothetical protein n=1 Tax=Catenulispora pinisilvae TaxID=2705253 RepID=UPI00189228EB|nr:hypothetical protein [Catenulispora pinisilvae]
MSGAALLMVAVALGGVRSEDGAQNSYWGGVSESGQTVDVAAQQAKTAAPTAASKANAPTYACSEEPDPSVVGSPGPAGATAGAWYRLRCTSDAGSLNTAQIPKTDLEVWVPVSKPVDLAQKAAKQIRLTAPVLNMSPWVDGPQWVNFPMFLWTDVEAWHPLSATASVPGLQVSATATPEDVIWDMGDGGTVSCAGPGTPFTDSTPAAASSPTCGYLYKRASDAEPGGTFTVRGTETWRVTWVGGGQRGTLPDLSATSSIAVRVAESQALVTSVH